MEPFLRADLMEKPLPLLPTHLSLRRRVLQAFTKKDLVDPPKIRTRSNSTPSRTKARV